GTNDLVANGYLLALTTRANSTQQVQQDMDLLLEGPAGDYIDPSTDSVLACAAYYRSDTLLTKIPFGLYGFQVADRDYDDAGADVYTVKGFDPTWYLTQLP